VQVARTFRFSASYRRKSQGFPGDLHSPVKALFYPIKKNRFKGGESFSPAEEILAVLHFLELCYHQNVKTSGKDEFR
jgi:hypothetical protein